MVRRLILSAALAAACASSLAATADELEAQAKQAMAGKDYVRGAVLWEQAFEQDRSVPWWLFHAACAHALAGENDKAFTALQSALENGFANAGEVESSPDLAPLHADARFAPLVAKMKDRQAFDARLYESPALATPYRENLGEDEKLAGLSKLWSEVKYNFVYVDTLKAIDWDKLYLEYIPKVRATRSTLEYYRVLMELVARLKDGHSGVWPAREAFDTWIAHPPVRTALVEDRVLVREVFDPALRAQGIVPGVEVTAVDGEPVKDYVARDIAPYMSASTPQDLAARSYGFFFLAGPIGKAPRVTFRSAAGKAFDATLKRVGWEDYRKMAQGQPFELRMLPGNVAYVALNEFGDDKAADGFIAAFDRIARSSALIIDLRNNGGGNSSVGYRVLATLTGKPFRTSAWSTRDYRPSYRAWGRALPNFQQVEPAFQPDLAHQYGKPVAVLTSGATYSAAEDFMVAYDAMRRGLIVGEPTGGSTGQPLMFSLPGGGGARVCTKADTYADGRTWVGTGIEPTLKVSPTVADLRKGKDTVLEAALAALRSDR